MGAHQNLVQGAVILAGAVVGALLDSAFNTAVRIAAHRCNLLFIEFSFSMGRKQKRKPGKNFQMLKFQPDCAMLDVKDHI